MRALNCYGQILMHDACTPSSELHAYCPKNLFIMADDTRDQPRGPPAGQTSPPDHVKNPKIYEVFNAPPASANALPDGYGQNTAGGRQEMPKLGDAVKTVRWQDFLQVHMYPCVRESMLTGIGSGFAVGGVRALLGGENHFGVLAASRT